MYSMSRGGISSYPNHLRSEQHYMQERLNKCALNNGEVGVLDSLEGQRQIGCRVD
jgi:hypothetical protein